MSSRHNRRKRRQITEVPVLVERVQIEQQSFEGDGKTYEEARWPWLSPERRAAHNRLLQARGMPTIPPPRIDMYVPPRAPVIKPFDPNDKEFLEAIREADPRLPTMGGQRGEEGFTINGVRVRS
jgi:hypothetical protein